MLRRELRDGQKVDAYQATLMDFGIAKMAKGASRITRDGTIGTLAYVSPEQIENAVNVDARADLYSFGVVMYEMLTGQLPFSGGSAASIIHGHLSQPVPDVRTLNPDLPQHVAVALERALGKTPVLRFQSACEFMEALSAKNSVTAV
jgi:serine/threonine protein kinase